MLSVVEKFVVSLELSVDVLFGSIGVLFGAVGVLLGSSDDLSVPSSKWLSVWECVV